MYIALFPPKYMKKLLPKSIYFSNVINVINIIVEDRLARSSKIPSLLPSIFRYCRNFC